MQQRETGAYKLHSNLLNQDISYYAIFPSNYQKSKPQLPVLYLLHGLFGRFDNWVTNTEILRYAQNLPFAIICAEGGDNWYSDSSIIENHFYESYFFEELIPTVENAFNIGGARNQRFIAGLSMGGYGAFKFAFRCPQLFSYAASMSGAFHAAEIFADDIWTELSPSVMNVFGNHSDIRLNNNLFQIVRDYPLKKIAELPDLYFNCGADDSFLSLNISLADLFKERKIKSEFEILLGGHDWGYWDQSLKLILDKISRRLQKD